MPPGIPHHDRHEEKDPSGELGRIILVNGASSAGKTTLCRAVQEIAPVPLWHFSIDHLLDAGIFPQSRTRAGEFRWADYRKRFFDGFYACLPALAGAGNDLLIENIVETEEDLQFLVRLLSPFDVFFVALHCPLDELERRERARGDRPMGDAKRDFETLHRFGESDLELQASNSVEDNARALLATWSGKTESRAFERMNLVNPPLT